MERSTYYPKLVGLTILIGLVTGLTAIALHDILKVIQTLAYGFSDGKFLVLASQVSSVRRSLAVMVGGGLAAICWYLLQKNSPLMSIKGQIDGLEMGKIPHLGRQLGHALTQILAVGFGVPVGKEVAPRELGTLWAGYLSRRGLAVADRKILLAAAAAAGLSAVYQTPIASVFFLFEGLKAKKSWQTLVLGSLMIGTATLVANLGIVAKPTYQVTRLDWSLETFLLALLLGLILPPLALWFKAGVQRVQVGRIKDKRLLFTLPVSMVLVAGLAGLFPEILGNGRDTVQAAFLGLPWPYALALLLVKILVVLLALKSGAYGGTLTPGFAFGSLLGLLLGTGLLTVFPNLSVPMASVLGAGIFLSVSMATPLTAIFLTMTFTGQSYLSLLPLCLGVGVAYLVQALMIKK